MVSNQVHDPLFLLTRNPDSEKKEKETKENDENLLKGEGACGPRDHGTVT